MDTITIESTEVGVPNISYTSAEVLRFIEKAKDYDNICTELNKALKEIRDSKNHVRDFFSEVEWSDGEQTVQKSDVNSLLESIGARKLTSTYGGSFTITGTFQDVEAEDEDDAKEIVENGFSVDHESASISIDSVEVDDIDENY